jgi:hypothetical protein
MRLRDILAITSYSHFTDVYILFLFLEINNNCGIEPEVVE